MLSYMRSTTMAMGTVTVRLGTDDERLLDQLAVVHGDRSTAVREAIRLLAGDEARRRGLQGLVRLIESEDGPIGQAGVEEYIGRYDL